MIVTTSTFSLEYDYSTGVQIVTCTLAGDPVLPESTGLLNPVLSHQPMKTKLTNQSANQRESFSLNQNMIKFIFQIFFEGGRPNKQTF